MCYCCEQLSLISSGGRMGWSNLNFWDLIFSTWRQTPFLTGLRLGEPKFGQLPSNHWWVGGRPNIEIELLIFQSIILLAVPHMCLGAGEEIHEYFCVWSCGLPWASDSTDRLDRNRMCSSTSTPTKTGALIKSNKCGQHFRRMVLLSGSDFYRKVK